MEALHNPEEGLQNDVPTSKAQKKAARRAAFIQEIVTAVRNDLYPGYRGAPTVRGPFATALRQWEKNQEKTSDPTAEQLETLYWAKHVGLLPIDATELPSEEVQRKLLANHKRRQVAMATKHSSE